MRFGIRMLGITTILFGMYGTALKDAHPQSAADSSTTPLILEKNEGEHRVRRPRETPVPTGPFTIKIDRKNGGSQKMFAGTEEIPAGGLIPRHKHLGQDEILLIQTGSAHVWLGTQERDVHAGAIVFIPSDTWISVKNTGNETINLAFVFSDPGFDEFMRCTSVPAGESSSTRVTHDEFKDCQHKGHVVYEGSDPAISHQVAEQLAAYSRQLVFLPTMQSAPQGPAPPGFSELQCTAHFEECLRFGPKTETTAQLHSPFPVRM